MVNQNIRFAFASTVCVTDIFQKTLITFFYKYLIFRKAYTILYSTIYVITSILFK